MVRQLRLGQLVLIAFIFFSSSAMSQEYRLSANLGWGLGYQQSGNMVFEPGYSSAGIRLDRIQQIKSSDFDLISGLELSYQGWGNQLLSATGARWNAWEWKRFGVSARLITFTGIALFKPRPLYTGAVEIAPVLKIKLGQKVHLYLTTGYRYAYCPGYKKYGTIWSYSDLVHSGGIAWKLN